MAIFTQSTSIPIVVANVNSTMSTLDVHMPEYGVCGLNVEFIVTPLSLMQDCSIVECFAEFHDWMVTGKSAVQVPSADDKGSPLQSIVRFILMPLREGHLKAPKFTQRLTRKNSVIMACSKSTSIVIAPSGHFATTGVDLSNK